VARFDRERRRERWTATASSQSIPHALHGVFLYGTAVIALVFLLSWWLKEVPLRTHTYPRAQLATEEARRRRRRLRNPRTITPVVRLLELTPCSRGSQAGSGAPARAAFERS
jgi:hypothetical protein